MVRIIRSDDALVRSHDHSRWRIVEVRQLRDRDVTDPLAGVCGTVVRQTTVAGFSNRNNTGSVVADVAVDVSVDDVLRRPRERLKRDFELVPVPRAVQGVVELAHESFAIKRGPTKSITFAVAFEDDWTMTCNGHVMRNDVVFGARQTLSDLDLFATNRRILPAGRRLITFRISGIKFFEVEVLDVWSNVGHSPGDMFVMTNDHTGKSA